MRLVKEQIDLMFEGNDWNSFHDVIIEVFESDHLISKLNCKLYFRMLPFKIQCIALQWNMSDTVFRDEAYEWFKEHKDEIKFT